MKVTQQARRRSAAGVVVLLASMVVIAQALLSGPAGAETWTYSASATAGSIVLDQGGSNQQTITDPSVTFSGSIDDVAGTITGTTAFQRAYTDSFAGPFGLTLYAAADILPLSPAQPVTGTYDPATGAVAATAGNRLVITVYNQTGPTQSPSTDGKLTNQSGQTCFVDLAFDFTGTFDDVAGTLSISDPAFTVPQFPAAPQGNPTGGCGLATDELNNRLQGPNNAVSLTFAGQLTTTTTTTSTTSTTTTAPTNPTTTEPASATTTEPTGPTTTAGPSSTCSPDYSPCIPDVAGDSLDCGDLEVTDVQVIGVDTYNLDADGDGIGCESSSTAPTTGSGTLPRTGQSSQGLVAVGSLLICGGAALVGLSRRRIARS
jgi:LPXTG-motif cell wall-anchored protein